jgi:hypothetical protein
MGRSGPGELFFIQAILLARKFNEYLTLQLMPTMVHFNLVPTKEDQNDVFSVGVGGRIKVTKRMSVNGEYHYLLPGKTADDYYNSLSVGVDLETGGHVFQLYFTNSRGHIEQQFIARTTGSWGNGDIHVGFTIHRTFTLKKPKSFRDE